MFGLLRFGLLTFSLLRFGLSRFDLSRFGHGFLGLPPDGTSWGDGLPWMEPVEKLGYLQWNPQWCHLCATVFIELLPDV
jgi:hypothetical protein